MDLTYLADKILNADFIYEPFKHIYIEDFFTEEHFNEIIKSKQIAAPIVDNDRELLNTLELLGYKTIGFPGCITNKEEYLKWHIDKKVDKRKNSAYEGFGMVYRLQEFESNILATIDKYIKSKEFNI